MKRYHVNILLPADIQISDYGYSAGIATEWNGVRAAIRMQGTVVDEIQRSTDPSVLVAPFLMEAIIATHIRRAKDAVPVLGQWRRLQRWTRRTLMALGRKHQLG